MRNLITTAIAIAGVASATAQITFRGSDTLGTELVPAWTDAYNAEGNSTVFDIAAEGSSAAFTNLSAGTANIGMASRAAKEEEIATATAAGVDLVPTVVCYDMICVIVNENNPVENLTLEQIQGIFTGTITDWSEVGGAPGEIAMYTRNTASGTFSAFKGLAMGSEEYSDSIQMMNGNTEICDEVAADVNGIGYVGLSYAEAAGGITTVSVDGVEAEAENAADYAISRGCYFYTNGEPAGEIAEFIEFCLSDEGDEITTEIGFIPTPDAAE